VVVDVVGVVVIDVAGAVVDDVVGVVVVDIVDVVGVEFVTIVNPRQAETNRNSEIKAAMTKNRKRLSSFLYMVASLFHLLLLFVLPSHEILTNR
jgi:hypothetical protein